MEEYHYWRMATSKNATTHLKRPLDKTTLCNRKLTGTAWRLHHPKYPLCSRCARIAPEVTVSPKDYMNVEPAPPGY
ncbi:MAG: hypothetical protein V3S68_04825 [Dehalococcoidia bacterium]